MKFVDLLRMMEFVKSDECLLSCWGLRVFSCVGISQMAYLCKFDKSDESNLVQK